MHIELIFTGLMAFVVGDGYDAGKNRCDPKDDATDHSLNVLMFDGKMAKSEHVPRLLVDTRFLIDVTNDPDEVAATLLRKLGLAGLGAETMVHRFPL